MGFWSRLFGSRTSRHEPSVPQMASGGAAPEKPPDDITSVWITGDGTFRVEVVGESHYQAALEQAAGGRSDESAEVEVEATLLLEDDNPYDSNAVCVQVEGNTVGHLPRTNAVPFREALGPAASWGLPIRCNAQIRGGWDRGERGRGSFGIWLDIA